MFSREEAIFLHKLDHERTPYHRHYGQKIQSRGNVSLLWLQYVYTYHIEKTGQDSVRYGKIAKNKEKRNKKRDKSRNIPVVFNRFPQER